ncbi:uncharacterized protein [Procambarus clarkii]|uniref:uncharacterized protein isoform X1 n=2 Tax=Procambarus clarkii TaxID=6728 RepID=UPI0037420AC7
MVVKVLVLLPLISYGASLVLPLLSEPLDPTRRERSFTAPAAHDASISSDTSRMVRWLQGLMGDQSESLDDPGDDPLSAAPRHSLPSSPRHSLPSSPRHSLPSKRSDGKVPTMDVGLGKRSSSYTNYFSLGVLSDMRKFFNELRTNLESVEEVGALSQDQGGVLDPAHFLTLLAKHGARLESWEDSRRQQPHLLTHGGRHRFGYSSDDQPYAHSGLGK